MPVSLHSHSGQFCKHATDTLDSVVQTAIEQGFICYGLSEHMPRNRTADLYPEESEMKPSELENQFDQFVLEASRLKQLHASKIELLIGMETELIDPAVTFDLLDTTLARHQESLDYLVGSVHHVNQIPIDFDLPMFEKAVLSFPSCQENPLEPVYQLCAAYFDAQYTLIDRYHPEVIGHFDLCLLFCPDLDLQSQTLVWTKIERNIKLGISYGALFEVNSAALRKGWSSPYPSPPILKLIISLGGRLTLSDDSHGSNRVGLNYGKMLEYLKSNNVQNLWYLVPTQTDQVLRPGNKVSAVKIPGDWWDHPFWSNLSAHTTSDRDDSSTSTFQIQLGSLKNSEQEIETSNHNERLRWKNFPMEQFTNQTWFIISTSLPFWKNKKNPTITYSSINDEPISSFSDLVEYHSSLTDEPSLRRKRIEGIDRPIQGENACNKKGAVKEEEEIVGWRWQGKGILRLLKSDWQLLGYHFSSSSSTNPPTTSGLVDLPPDWVVTFFHKTLFTPAGIDIYSKNPLALSDQLKLQLIQALQNHPSKVVSNLADSMFDVHHDESINTN